MNGPLSSTVIFKSNIKLYMGALIPLYAALPRGRFEPAPVRALLNELAVEFERRRVRLGVRNTQSKRALRQQIRGLYAMNKVAITAST
jgi:hypothetical protein